jgi:AAA family ATP:ADP antiporter
MWLGTIKERMERALLVCRSEWGALLWMALLSFLLVGGSTLGFCVVNAVYMSAIYRYNFGLEVFPLAFVIAAGLMIPYFAFYTHVEKKVSRQAILTASFLTYSGLLFLFGYMLGLNSGDYYLLLTVFVITTCIMLLINLQYWSFANLIFHPRQGKRLFPLLGMGGILGATIMGFSVKHLLGYFKTANTLFYLWGGIFLLSCAVVFLIYRFLPLRREKLAAKAPHFIASIDMDFKVIDRLPLLRVMAGIIFVMSAVSFIIYFKFNERVGALFPQENDFAGFIGDFNGILNLTILFYQLLLTGRIVSSLGIINSLFLYPGFLLVPGAAMAAAPPALSPLYAARFIDELCKETLFQTASESIYGSVPDNNREQAMNFMKMIVTPLSIAASGLLMIILFRSLGGHAALAGSLVLVVMLAGWAYLLFRLKDLYIETLFGNFVSGDDENRLESFRALTHLKSGRTSELLQRILKLGSVKMKLFALELAGEMKMHSLKQEIFEFISSPENQLKTQAISALGKIGGRELYPRLIKVYKDETSEVKKLILDNLQDIDPWSFEINAPLLLQEEKDPVIQGYLLEFIWSKRPLLTEQEEILKALLASPERQVRLEAARCLRYDRSKKFVYGLIDLLNDGDGTVQKEAIISAGEVRATSAIPRLLKLMEGENAALAEMAAQSLARIKLEVADRVIGDLDFREPFDVLTRKLKLIAATGDAMHQFFLLKQVDHVMPEAIAPALEVFARSLPTYRTFSRQEKTMITSFIKSKAMQIRDEFMAAHVLRKHLHEKKEPDTILLMLIKERIDTLRRIILLGLHLLYPGEKILTVMENVFSGDMRKKNIAVEALENLLPMDYRKTIIPLFEKDNLVEEMEYIVDLYNLDSVDCHRMLEIISRYGDSWMKSWVFYTAGLLRLKSWRPLMEEAARSADPLTAEHARVGLGLLDGDGKNRANKEG